MRSRLSTLGAVVTLAVAVVLLASSCAIPLGDLGGPTSWAYSINEGGVIVGISELPGSTPEDLVERAFRRSPDGTVTELASLAGSHRSGAVDINDAGVIAGTAMFPGATAQDETAHAVRWDPDGTIHDLGPIGSTDASVRAVDVQGRIVGIREPGSGDSKAFVFDPAVGHLVDLPDLPGATRSLALGMNDVGDVVGYQWVVTTTYPVATPVRWDLDAGTVTDLTGVWGPGLLSDIDDGGTVVGLARFPGPAPMPNHTEAAVLRPGETTPTPLGTGNFGIPFSINDEGVIVGWFTSGAAAGRAFRWSSSTGAVALTTDQPSYATDVNDRGQIVGQSADHAALLLATPPTAP